MSQRIGCIGLGAMGSKLAGRLLNQGFALTVYNRTAEKAKALQAQGAVVAQSPRELAKNNDVILLSITDDKALNDLMRGESGAFAGAKKGTIFVDCSTVSVRITREMHTEAARLGFEWLDAPVLGGPQNAEKGDMPFVVGGSSSALDTVRPVLEAIGQKIVYMGDSGLGQAAKIVHNLACGISLIAFSESVLLGEKLGLSRKQTLDVLHNGAVSSMLLNIKMQKIETDTFTPTMAPLVNMHKDLTLAEDAAQLVHLSLPALNVAKHLYDTALSMGLDREDTSSVFRALKKEAE